MKFSKKTFLIYACLILFPVYLLGQSNEIDILGGQVYLDGDEINKFNKKGLKHGIWVNYDIVGPTLITYTSQKIVVIQSCFFGDSSYCTREVTQTPEELIRTDTLDDVIYKTRRLGEYVHGKKNGTWLSFYGNGKIWKEIHYEKAKISRTFKVYYQNGSLQYKAEPIEEKGQYTFQEYSESGEVLKTTQVDQTYLEKSL